MNNVFSNNVAWGWHLHLILGGALFLGVVFLVIWAVRFMSKKELTNWTLWLIVLGIIGVLLTAGFGFNGWKQMMRWHNGWDLERVNWESMMSDIKEEDYKDLGTREEWEDFMLEQMEEHMGFGE